MHIQRRKLSVSVFLAATSALLLMTAVLLIPRSTANAETYDLAAIPDICMTPFASIDVVTGDVVNITGTSSDPQCEPVDLSPWSNLWTVEQFPNNGDPLYRVTITQTGSAAVDFGNGRELTINASPGVPGAPTINEVVPGDRQATVYFSPPATEGGSPITSYTVTTEPGGATTSGSSSPITVTGLDNGASYTFTVAATNSFGTGPASDPSAAVIPLPAAEVGLVVNPSPSDRGNTVELVATVSGDNPTGNVEFLLDGQSIGSANLEADGTATLETGPLELGSYTFRALYSGDGSNLAGDSGDVSHEVTLASSTITLSTDYSHILAGEMVRLTAVVQSTFDATGTVTFLVDGEPAGTGDIANGTAILVTGQFAPGPNEVTAEYAGDAYVAGSTSEPITVFVHELPAETSTATPNPSETPEPTPTPTEPTPTSTPAPTESPTSTPTAQTGGNLATGASAGSSTLDLAGHGFRIGDVIRISPGLPNEETRTITGLDPLTVDRPLEFDHPAGAGVVLSDPVAPTATPSQGTPVPGGGGQTPIPPGTGSGSIGGGVSQTPWVAVGVLCLALGIAALTFARVRR